MKIYVGQTRSRKLIAKLNRLGWGECTNRGEAPPRRRPWFLDNGAFSDFNSGRDFDGAAFLRDLRLAAEDPIPPDFVVCPDRVASGTDSLAFSLRWLDTYGGDFPAQRFYLVVQDGMTEKDVRPHLDRFAGIFVGGSPKTDWKTDTGKAWVELARARGIACHVGRVGTVGKVRWVKGIQPTSIDSSLPLWSDENLRAFRRALAQELLFASPFVRAAGAPGRKLRGSAPA